MNDRLPSRLPSHLIVGALLRRVNDAGGLATLLARGDAQGGAILVIALEKGEHPRALERGFDSGGLAALLQCSSPDLQTEQQITEYWQRRRNRDPDLWVIELDIALAERFAAETMLGD